MIATVCYALDLLTSLALIGNKDANSRQRVRDFVIPMATEQDALRPLLGSKVVAVGQKASAAMLALTTTALEDELQGVARDLVDALRLPLLAPYAGGSMGEEEEEDLDGLDAAEVAEVQDMRRMETFRFLSHHSGPMTRVLRGVQGMVSRWKTEDHFLPSTLHLLFPFFSQTLCLHAVLPGAEMAFYLLDK